MKTSVWAFEEARHQLTRKFADEHASCPTFNYLTLSHVYLLKLIRFCWRMFYTVNFKGEIFHLVALFVVNQSVMRLKKYWALKVLWYLKEEKNYQKIYQRYLPILNAFRVRPAHDIRQYHTCRLTEKEWKRLSFRIESRSLYILLFCITWL